jgi:hypothetical protein
LFGLVWAVHAAGILTALSGLLAWAQMSETLPGARMPVDDAALGTAAATRGSATPQTP